MNAQLATTASKLATTGGSRITAGGVAAAATVAAGFGGFSLGVWDGLGATKRADDGLTGSDLRSAAIGGAQWAGASAFVTGILAYTLDFGGRGAKGAMFASAAAAAVFGVSSLTHRLALAATD